MSPGGIVALLGKNGMGKSTLLKIILALVPLRAGTIHAGGKDTAALSPAKLIALGMSYVPQDQPLFQDLTIRDNLRLAVQSDAQLISALEHVFSYFPFFERPAEAAHRHVVGR